MPLPLIADLHIDGDTLLLILIVLGILIAAFWLFGRFPWRRS
jgi:hypothetical protein